MLKKFISRYTLSDLLFGLLVCVMLLIAFHPGAKSFFLQTLMKTGLFNPHIGREKPQSLKDDVLFRDINGRVISLRSLRGKKVFINFWATWCPPCRAEMPALQKLFLQIKNQPDVVFITVDADADLAKSSAFLKSNGLELPLAAPAAQIPETLFGGTLPTTVVIDRNGKVVYRHEGMADYSSKNFAVWLKSK